MGVAEAPPFAKTPCPVVVGATPVLDNQVLPPACPDVVPGDPMEKA
jgi:hypothetical protein